MTEDEIREAMKNKGLNVKEEEKPPKKKEECNAADKDCIKIKNNMT